MREELKYIGEKIISNKLLLAKSIAVLQNELFVKDANSLIGEHEASVLEWHAELISYLGEYLVQPEPAANEKVVLWARESARSAIEIHLPLTLSLRSLSFYRTVIWDVFTEELEQRKFAPITMLDVSKILDPIMDEVSAIIGQVYDEHSQKMMKLAYTALEELSIPVVPVSKDTGIIPIIGEIDTRRSHLLMKSALQESVRLGFQYLILDISGVTIIDTMVADHVLKVIEALNLIGVKTCISGIRPEIAQTIVSLGIDLSNLQTFANLHTALASIGIKKNK
ncbi:STAS domain-containing protein [Heyndrickxia acidicola]|uniref:STAS domain-containing protein n=1 Tax=Heyndrickxia acidicola TaxID=209389 RepID=A0ABU6MIV5_9BACI|nr:STAS domain-containing protein [Heyndrickxia acidicola]MED1204337.1 STAS domain-containing protein [Heyndrickxia acidicola]